MTTFTAPNGNHKPCPSRRRHSDGVCPICGCVFYNAQQRICCSPKCAGERHRRESEKKYRLDAFDEWSPDMAYALGLLYSDGNIHRPGGLGTWRIQFFNTELPTVEWLHAFMGSPNKISCKVPKKLHPKPTWKVRVVESWKTCYQFAVTSPTLGDRLWDIGLRPGKSKEDHPFPDVPSHVLSHFVRGYFDGDGGVWVGPSKKSKGGRMLQAGLASNVPTFRRVLRERIEEATETAVSEFGINLRLSGSSAEKFMLWLYASNGQRMARKQAVWDDWCVFRSQYGGLICETDPWETLRGLRPQPWHGLVGSKPDKELAESLGLSKSNVAAARKKLEVPPSPKPKLPPAFRPWHALAGTIPDVEVARIGDVSKAMVCMYRKEVGIPSFRSTEKRRAPWHPLVGSMPDTRLAAYIGVSRNTVLRHRQEFNLPVYHRGQAHG